MGSLPGDLVLSATGGTNVPTASSSGNGGTINLTSGNSLLVNTASLTVGPLGTNGNGGNVTLTSNSQGLGQLSLSGSLLLNGNGMGNGGQLTITANTDNAISVGSGTSDNIGAAAGSSGGVGGTIAITNTGTGGISFSSNSGISVNGTSGNGGSVTLTSNIGPISLPGQTISANAGSQASYAGSITIQAFSLAITGSSPILALSANAAGTATGGTINVTTLSSTSDLIVGYPGSSLSYITASATGGSAGSSYGDGGSISISAGRNLTVNPLSQYLSVSPQGQSGYGGYLALGAGQSAGGTLIVNGAITLNGGGTTGAGSGSGGTIELTAKSPTAIAVNGNLTANGGSQNGYGGYIYVNNTGTGGITFTGVTTISAAGGTGGTYGYGGNISINGTTVTITGSPLAINASGSGSGSGGYITVAATGSSGILTVGSASGQMSLNAGGGSVGSAYGSAGSISVTAAEPDC